MDETGLRPLGLALPLDDVGSGEIDLAGRLAELVDRLGAAVARLGRDQPLDAWVAALEASLADLADVAPHEAWQLTQARAELAGVVAAADSGGPPRPLSLGDIRSLLADRLAGRPTRANFRTGRLTVCSMVPMRSVPHRVVALLGLDDQVFPRSTRPDGDDVLARDPWVGERDARSEDRQLLLDAILAAEERLVLLYTGRDQRTGAERPPAVPLGELVDVLARTAGGPVLSQVVTRHPLQYFDPRNFTAGASEPPFSFDRSGLGGGRALLRERIPPAPFLTAPLPAVPVRDVGLDELTRFFDNPVRAFLRQRLELRLLFDDEEPPDALPVQLDGLEQWAVGERMLRARLAGADAETTLRSERLRGGIPPGVLGDAVLRPVADHVESLVAAAQPFRRGEPEQHDVSVGLPGGATLAGTVTDVYADTVLRVEYSRLGAKHRLRAWIAYLALAAGLPGRDWSAVTVGRARDGVRTSRLSGVAPEAARAELGSLVAVYAAGLCEPLPLPPKTAEAYAARRHQGSGPHAATLAARDAWRRSYDGREIGEFDDPAHVVVWGDATLDALLAPVMDAPAHPARSGAWPEEEHRLGVLARTVWAPLLSAEALL
jgi:exodeoxyribonuclease V gamma subunit